MTQRITPEKFWITFSKAFNEHWFSDTSSNTASFGSSKKWTDNIIPFLESLAEKLEFDVISREYWPRVDVAFFSQPGEDWSEWALEVAIEHENKEWPAWQEECNKLMSLNAGLKVLIVYSEKDTPVVENWLGEFTAIWKSRKYHQENDTYLFIVGPTMTNWEQCDFRAYSFDGISLKDITGDNNTFATKRK